jgi:hypothetical protein
VDRADHQKDNMGLTHWENAPHGKIHKYDVSIAKNYLSECNVCDQANIMLRLSCARAPRTSAA